MIDIKLIQEKFEEEMPNGKLIYLTLGGSHLFGLNTKNSDIDVKGLYLPSQLDTHNYKEQTHLDFSTNKSRYKNSKEDIDIELFSIEKYFDMMATGDTNAYDLLFSMFAPTVLLDTKESKVLKENYRDLLSTNSKAFLGYVVAQTKKYGVKGERYDALKNIYQELINFLRKSNYLSGDSIKPFIDYIETKQFPYVKSVFIEREDNVGGGRYIEILNKEYRESVGFKYLIERLEIRLNQYGERSKKASEGIDFKSLSHAYRIILEFDELLRTQFIKFPLAKKKSILKVKQGDLSEFGTYENLLNFLDEEVTRIQGNLNGMTSAVSPMIFNKLNILILSQV